MVRGERDRAVGEGKSLRQTITALEQDKQVWKERREGEGERGKKGSRGGWRKGERQEDKLGATFLSPLSCYVQDLEVKVQAVVEETKALKHSLQRLQQSSASREEVSKRLIVFKLSQLSK